MKNISSISIRKRLVLYFIISVLIPTGIVTVTVYHRSKDIIEKKITETNKNNMETIAEVVEKKIESIYDISTLITYNPAIIDILSTENDRSAISIVNEITELEELINGYYLFGQSYTDSDYMFSRIYMVDRPEYNQYKISNKILSVSEIENQKWYLELDKAAFSIAGKDQMNIFSRKVDTIKLVRRLYRTDNPFDPFAALLTIDIDESYFSNLLERLKLSEGCTSYIISDKGLLMIGKEDENSPYINAFHQKSLSSELEYYSEITTINEEEVLLSLKSIPKVKWKIITISPLNELNQEMDEFNRIMFIILILCGFIALVAAILLSNDLSKPIEKLVDSMKNIDQENLQIDIYYKREDEFGFLIEHYKQMMARIRELIDKLYISEIKKNKAELKAKEAEMEALVAQINPHFLYNTLDSINWLAIKYHVDDISTMVKSLSKIFRYSLNGNNVTTIEEEMEHVKSYLVLQQNRFKDHLEYYLEIDENIKSCQTLKLILQPLVENAIIHGFRNQTEAGFIWIRGQKINEENLAITVSDNGVGGDLELLKSRLEISEDRKGSIGIYNVNSRIRNFFGDQYGLSFSNNKEGGLTVTVLIKAIHKEVSEC